MSTTQLSDHFEEMTFVDSTAPPLVANEVKRPPNGVKCVPKTIPPIRLTFTGGQLAELLALVPSLRRATLCSTKGGFSFCFYRGCLVGGIVIEQQLLRLLEEPEATAEIVSSDQIEDVLEGTMTIQGLVMDFAKRKDERSRSDIAAPMIPGNMRKTI